MSREPRPDPAHAPSAVEGLGSLLFGRLVDSLPSAVLVETTDRRIFTANRAFCLLFGTEEEPETLIGRDSRTWVRDASPLFQDARGFTGRIEATIEEGEPVRGDVLQLADGRVLEREYTPIRARDGVAAGHMWQYRDVTAERRAEDELRASEVKFRQLFDNASDGIFLHDRNGSLVDVNRRACEVLGYARHELLAMDMRDVDIDFEPARIEELWHHVQPGEPITTAGIHRRRDGTTFPVEVRVTLFDLGEREVMLAMARNLTERNRLEEQLLQAQKMEAIGRLAGGIAHDFNNVLTAIMGHAALLSAELKDDGPAAEDVRQIQDSAERAASLTRHLLAFSRQQVLQPERVDAGMAVRRTEGLLRRLIGEDIHLDVDLPAGGAHVLIDPGKLEHALINLAVNARDAMPHGGRLSLVLRGVELGEEEVARFPFPFMPGPYALMSVSDTGTGIPEPLRSKIFEPFFSTKPKDKGTGLGLSMVYGFVKQSGGYVWVDSAEGEGSTFHIALPRVGPPGAEDEPETAGSEPGNGKGTVLVVEDEPSVLSVVRRALADRGYHVLEGRDGFEALDVLRRHQGDLDLLVTDAVMPRMGGLELARRVRAEGRNVPILITSGYSSEVVAAMESLGGVVRFLEKPFSAGDVGRAVGRMTGGRGPDPME